MKYIATVALLAVMFGIFVANIFGLSMTWNGMDFAERDSIAYVERTVNGDPGEVIFGESKNLEDGSANTVSAIVVDYRSFDTLGEITILFLSTLGVGFVLGGHTKRIKFKHQPNFILTTGSKLIFGFILIFGVYMFLHGHLTPGGGFPGGALIAGAFLLLYLTDESYMEKTKVFKILEGTAGTLYVLIGIAGLLLADYFLANLIPTGTVGDLFSAGIIPVIYAIIGLKVGSELTGIFDKFLKEEVSD